MAITPDGRRIYVTNTALDTVSVIDTATNSLVGGQIGVGHIPEDIAIAPDGKRAYVANPQSNSVSVIDTATNTAIATVPVGSFPNSVAASPDGARVFVANSGGGVSVINTATNALESPIAAGGAPEALGFVPNQSPTASFAVPAANAGSPATFDASASSDSDGAVARYDWDFGDGTFAPDGGPTPAHTYAAPGTYTAKLTTTDNEGCSTQFVFTGQTASCNGKASAATQFPVSVAPAVPDTVAPTASLGKTKKKYEGSKVKFSFSASEADATFTCKLDKAKPKGCASPVTYKKLKPGKHKFSLFATDLAGNVGPTEKVKFKMVPKRP
jgi:YVTN family beta-propeller protein